MALTEEQLEEIALRAWNEFTGEQNARIHPLLFEFASRFLAALPKPEAVAAGWKPAAARAEGDLEEAIASEKGGA